MKRPGVQDIRGPDWVIPAHIQAQREWWFSFDPESLVKFHAPRRPNWFHRFLQRAFFGVRWGRVIR